MITIIDFPLPPSVNNYLIPVAGKLKWKGKGKPYATARMVKSTEHRQYETDCQLWALKYKRGLCALREEIIKTKQLMEKEKLSFSLKMEYFIFLAPDQYNSVEHKDVDNFIKPLQDNLAKILNIDDRHIFQITAEKVLIDDPNQKPCAAIRITRSQMRYSTEVMNMLKGI